MIINLYTLREMIREYIIIEACDYDIKVICNNLIYDDNNQIFMFDYTLIINNNEINNNQTLFKGDIINIVNKIIGNDNEKIIDYNVTKDNEKNDIFIYLKKNNKIKKIER